MRLALFFIADFRLCGTLSVDVTAQTLQRAVGAARRPDQRALILHECNHGEVKLTIFFRLGGVYAHTYYARFLSSFWSYGAF